MRYTGTLHCWITDRVWTKSRISCTGRKGSSLYYLDPFYASQTGTRI